MDSPAIERALISVSDKSGLSDLARSLVASKIEIYSTGGTRRHLESEGIRVRGYVSTCFGCPYEGAVDAERAVSVAARLDALGCDEVSIGDTIGVAVPSQVSDMVGRLRGVVPVERLAVHFHDTRGTALANVLAALQEGVSVVDSAAGGLGGCPYAPGAAGNLATEDLLYMLHGMGISTGVDLHVVAESSRALARRLGRTLPSRYVQAGPPPGDGA